MWIIKQKEKAANMDKRKDGINLRKMIVISIVILFIGGVISVPLMNDYYAYRVERTLCETPLPDKTIVVESMSQAGKLTGNGNGMQYFGAILIRSELSLAELEAYYSGYRDNEWTYQVNRQDGQRIEMIDHEESIFSKKMVGSGYYIIYSWGNGIPLFEELDIRGH